MPTVFWQIVDSGYYEGHAFAPRSEINMTQQTTSLPPPKSPRTPGIEYTNFSNLVTILWDKEIECLFQSMTIPELAKPFWIQPTPFGGSTYSNSLGRSRVNKISGIILDLIRIHMRRGGAEIYTCIICHIVSWAWRFLVRSDWTPFSLLQ